MEHRNQLPQSHEPAKGSNFLRACFNGLDMLSGIGILSVPFALSQGGWLSLILIFLVAIMCWYTWLLLKRCMDVDPVTIKTYPDMDERAFGYTGRTLVAIFMYLEIYLLAVEFLILEGDNLNKLFPHVSFRVAGLEIGGRRGSTVLTALLALPTTWLRSLDMLAFVAATGVLASVVLVANCVYGLVQLMVWGFMRVLCFGIGEVCQLLQVCLGFVILAMHVFLHDLIAWKVLLVCFVTSTVTYGSMAVLDHLMYGEHLKSQVALNLPIKKISNIYYFSKSPDQVCCYNYSNCSSY